MWNADGKRKSESWRSPVSRNTPLFSSSHSHRCSSHSTHAYEMGEQAKTRLKFASSTGRLGVHRSAAGSQTLCITDSVTRSSILLDRGRITESAGVQSRCRNSPSAGLSWRPGHHCGPVAESSQALGLEYHQFVQPRKSVFGLTRGERVGKEMTGQAWRTLTTEPCF